MIELHATDGLGCDQCQLGYFAPPDFQKVGIDNLGVVSNDAAFVVTLYPGADAAVSHHKNSTTGLALIDAFEEN